jgi:NADH-quinone oxidoreductase subunit C
MATLQELLQERFSDLSAGLSFALGELTFEIPAARLIEIALILRDEANFSFEQLIDLCGVDYLDYGVSEWQTNEATAQGFDRGVEKTRALAPSGKPRFAVVYHLLSIKHNQRLRLKVFVEENQPLIESVNDIWNAANWYEREAFDLYGLLFNGHPDLRRLLTDYGFVGYPFRKDFPMIGQVEMRYDATLKRVVYEPVSIDDRTLVPRVIRHDNRYEIDR